MNIVQKAIKEEIKMVKKGENIMAAGSHKTNNKGLLALAFLSLVVYLVTSVMNARQVNGFNVILVKVAEAEGKAFRQTATNTWVETDAAGIVQFSYTETKRDESRVYLSTIAVNNKAADNIVTDNAAPDTTTAGRTIILDIRQKLVLQNGEHLYTIKKSIPKRFVNVGDFYTLGTKLEGFYFANEFTTDGCSIPRELSISKLKLNIDALVPEKYYEQFYSACVAHDYCYVSSWVPVGYYDERPLCDVVFFENMKQQCRNDQTLNAGNRVACLAYARAFYTAVYSNSKVLMIMAQVSNGSDAINATKTLQRSSDTSDTL